jgi:hypothetical protein
VEYIRGLLQWNISEVCSSGTYQKSAVVVEIRGLQQWYISEVCSSGIYQGPDSTDEQGSRMIAETNA